ncbi:MAG TPA: M20/M25/M40 family metallo-hydrolase, partial [Planctomycetaceae bacterium]|nr:M20/M25/M40 family metallo-hydrolase [Planctomycetaceae bacterium]
MIERILERIRQDDFREWLVELLVEICRIDTTPSPDIARMRDAEAAVFDILERELKRLPFRDARCRRRPIDPAIARHPAFSKLHFTKTRERPEGLSPEEAYAERTNLLYLVDGVRAVDGAKVSAGGVALNAHIDVVAPFFPPRVENGVVFGRGTCDDKGNVVAMIGALRAVAETLADEGRTPRVPLTAMIVVEEETGGNGSLSLALDRKLRERYDTLLVLECCENRIYPANRGAVWYQFEIRAAEHGVDDVELVAFLIEELENEGRAIRAESRHRLFPQRPVQTCQGILDRYGEHPSRICGAVRFEVRFASAPNEAVRQLVQDVLDFAVREYVGLYGDKTQQTDPTTGRPKVERHYDLAA